MEALKELDLSLRPHDTSEISEMFVIFWKKYNVPADHFQMLIQGKHDYG